MSIASKSRDITGEGGGFRLRDIPVLLVLLAATLGTAAVGSIALPLGAAVEVEMLVEVR